MTKTEPALLVLMRHGQAEPYRSDDASRALVAAGVAEAERAARFLQQQGYVPTDILASPYRRAQQTADTLQRSLALSVAIATESSLQPDGDADQVAQLLTAVSDAKATGSVSVLLVTTHMPLVSGLLYVMTGRDQGFSTGSLAVLARATTAGAIPWRVIAEFDPAD